MNIKRSITATLLLCFLLLSGCGNHAPESEEVTYDYTITIPGLSKEYEFLYLTDAHIVVPDEDADDQTKTYEQERLSQFINDQGTTSKEQFERFMEDISNQSLDGLLLGGDLIDSPSASNLSLLEQLFKPLQFPYLYTVGNHDWTYPWDYMTEEGKANYLPLLQPYMDGSTAIHSLDYDEFIIVSVDNSSNQIDPAALDTYRNILSSGKPVILMLHVPLMTDALLEEAKKVWRNGVVLGGGVNGGIYPNDVSAEFISMTTASDSPVAAILSGHVHFTHSSNIVGEKSIPQYVGGAFYEGNYTKILLK